MSATPSEPEITKDDPRIVVVEDKKPEEPVVEGKLTKPMSQLDCAKLLCEAMKSVVAAMGFEVEVKFNNEVPFVGDRGLLIEGMIKVANSMGILAAGFGIDPREVIAMQQAIHNRQRQASPDSKIILPG